MIVSDDRGGSWETFIASSSRERRWLRRHSGDDCRGVPKEDLNRSGSLDCFVPAGWSDIAASAHPRQQEAGVTWAIDDDQRAPVEQGPTVSLGVDRCFDVE
jgi:hypothetical protein